MPTYKEMYLTLIRAQCDAISILQEAHQKAEELLLSADVPEYLRVLRFTSDNSPAQEAPSEGETVYDRFQKNPNMDIHCLHLSGRIYNALKYQFGERGRGYVPMIKDILSIESYEQLRKIRNLGKKSYLELITKMQEVGFTDWSEQMFNSAKRVLQNRK